MKNIALIALAALITGCGGQQTKQVNPPAKPTEDTTVVKKPDTTETAVLKDTLISDSLPENLYINIEVKDYGTMKVKFYTKDAPENVTNVANLAIKEFYNGLTFHRIVPNFVVQGGDPKGDGTGGPGYTVKAEIKRKHEKGSIAMARIGGPANPEKRSSGSQFYLCLQPLPQLDGEYTVIGKLVQGMDVLEKLGKVETGQRDMPVEPVIMESVTVTTE